jgi:hypothetical protein
MLNLNLVRVETMQADIESAASPNRYKFVELECSGQPEQHAPHGFVWQNSNALAAGLPAWLSTPLHQIPAYL